MTGPERVATKVTRIEAIRAAAAGQRSLQGADPTLPAPPPAAAFSDYIAPDDRVIPPVVMDGALSLGIPPHPAGAYQPCPICRHISWRTAPGSPVYECGCPPGPRGCHYPAAARFSAFPASLPPDEAA